jgi:hypothetical protein
LVRQKIGGASLSFFVLKQIPAPLPESYNTSHTAFLLPRVLELTCTAWDVQPFFNDAWNEADDIIRKPIERHWCENREGGGSTYDSPRMVLAAQEPLPAGALQMG